MRPNALLAFMSPSSPTAISRLFGRSPFTALVRHIATVDGAGGRLHGFLAAARAGDREQAATLHEAIVDCEHAADDLKDDIRLNLPRRPCLPISRGDLLELIEARDRIVNRIREISGLMLGRRMQFPEAVADRMATHADTAIDAIARPRALLGEFDELPESGFAGGANEPIAASVARPAALEKRADDEERRLRQALLALKADPGALDMMFFYQVIDGIGTLAHRAERVGTRPQILVSH